MSKNASFEKLKSVVPAYVPGGAYLFQTFFTAIGVGLAIGAERFDVESQARALFKLDGSVRSMGLTLGLVAFVTWFVLLPAVDKLFGARRQFKVGHPVHHVAPGECGLSESDR